MDIVIPLLQVFVSCVWIHHVESKCRPDQIQSCKQAAKAGDLSSFHAGGTCTTKHYVHFTHVCSVQNYLPSTDFCCCVEERRVMCCLYHQTWGTFRCTQADDTIDKIRSNWSASGLPSPLKSPPLEVLLPAILLPLAVLVCCAVCIVKCCCYKYDADDNEHCDITCLNCCHKEEPKKPCTPCPKRQTSVSKEETYPLSQPEAPHAYPVPHGVGSQFSTESTGSEAKLLPAMDDPIAAPSAPPLLPHDDPNALGCYHTRFSRLNSDTSAVSGGPYHRDSRSLSTSASIVTNTSGITDPCPHCATNLPTCPPPTYDEHHRDRVLT